MATMAMAASRTQVGFGSVEVLFRLPRGGMLPIRALPPFKTIG